MVVRSRVWKGLPARLRIGLRLRASGRLVFVI